VDARHLKNTWRHPPNDSLDLDLPHMRSTTSHGGSLQDRQGAEGGERRAKSVGLPMALVATGS
jgi:hypothetical protein